MHLHRKSSTILLNFSSIVITTECKSMLLIHRLQSKIIQIDGIALAVNRKLTFCWDCISMQGGSGRAAVRARLRRVPRSGSPTAVPSARRAAHAPRTRRYALRYTHVTLPTPPPPPLTTPIPPPCPMWILIARGTNLLKIFGNRHAQLLFAAFIRCLHALFPSSN